MRRAGAPLDRFPLGHAIARVGPRAAATPSRVGDDWHDDLAIPWIELAILLPLIGAFWVSLGCAIPTRPASTACGFRAWRWSVHCGAWLSLDTQRTIAALAREQWDDGPRWLFGRDMFVVDEAERAAACRWRRCLFLLTELATLRTKVRRFSFASVLRARGDSAGHVCLQAAVGDRGCCWPRERFRRGWSCASASKPTRVYVLHMAPVRRPARGRAGGSIARRRSASQLAAGRGPADGRRARAQRHRAGALLDDRSVRARFVRHGALCSSRRWSAPMPRVRLVLPIAPDWVLRSIALLSLVTAVYAACMALVQHEARRFFCYVVPEPFVARAGRPGSRHDRSA